MRKEKVDNKKGMERKLVIVEKCVEMWMGVVGVIHFFTHEVMQNAQKSIYNLYNLHKKVDKMYKREGFHMKMYLFI